MARKRMIDPRIWDSEQVMSLTDSQFKLYIYLISQADDEGRVKISISLFKSRLYPHGKYKNQGVLNDLSVITHGGLIECYSVQSEDGKKECFYLHHPNWLLYQKINRPTPSIIPNPNSAKATIIEDSLSTHGGLIANGIEVNRIEKKRKKSKSAANDIDTFEDDPAAQARSTAPVQQKPSFNFITHLWENITDEKVEEWANAFPACDVELELAKMAKWLEANPTKRKSNYARFIFGWLTRSQDRGGTK